MLLLALDFLSRPQIQNVRAKRIKKKKKKIRSVDDQHLSRVRRLGDGPSTCLIKSVSVCDITKKRRCAGKMRDTVVVTAQQLGGGDKRPSTAATGNAAFNADGSRGSTAVAPPLRSSSRSVKNRSKTLLRELCVDKDYLEQLTIDPSK